MYGKVRDGTFWIMDAAALPVQGTETRVNAGNEVSDHQSSLVGCRLTLRLSSTWCSFRTLTGKRGRKRCSEDGITRKPSRPVKHELTSSHPGYGCWLSGIDVGTQTTNQKFSDPYLAVVVSAVSFESSIVD
jgi:COP9 signalosome complex subunit 5